MDEREYQDALKSLSETQLRYVAARMGASSDKEAAQEIGVNGDTPSQWSNKPLINEIVKYARLDGVQVVREQLRRAGTIAVQTLIEVARDGRKGGDRVAAANSVLDRIGVSAKTQVELSGTVAYVKGYVNVSPDDWPPPPPTSPDDTAGER